jgi:hypothetical protein
METTEEENIRNAVSKCKKEELEWLKLNRDTRVKLLIETGVKKLNGLIYEMNLRIEQIEEDLQKEVGE